MSNSVPIWKPREIAASITFACGHFTLKRCNRGEFDSVKGIKIDISRGSLCCAQRQVSRRSACGDPPLVPQIFCGLLNRSVRIQVAGPRTGPKFKA